MPDIDLPAPARPLPVKNRIATLCLAFWAIWSLPLAGQRVVAVGPNFSEINIVPALLRDASRQWSIEEVSPPERRPEFFESSTPFLGYGSDPANWWFCFRAKNYTPTPKAMIIRLNRKNFDEFRLWQRDPTTGELLDLGAVGVLHPTTDGRFEMIDGYHFAVTLPPGETMEYFGRGYNRVGSMHLGLSLHTAEHFALMTRQNSIEFGLFLGVMLVTLLFTAFLLVQYGEPVYLFYLLYILNILLREAHEFSADFGLLPNVQRHATSVMVAATFGMFYRHFMQLWELAPLTDRLVKWYVWGVSVLAFVMVILTATDQSGVLRWISMAVNFTNLVFTVLALSVAAQFSRRSLRARVTLLTFFPVACAFVAILLRNMNVIGNHPWTHHAVMWGFVFEVVILTTVFAVWYRTVEGDRDMLQLNLRREKLEKLLAVQTAEQRVKDRIARDLHDDVAASMSGIRILSQVARSQFAEKSPEAAPILEQINRSAQSAVESIGDLIWAVKPSDDYLNDIADRIREYAAKMLEAAEIDYRLQIPRNLPTLKLDIESKRNIYLIFKEAINNALKYSRCTLIEISLGLENQRLVLKVADNGHGFDHTTTRSGNGLGNMAKRARDIGGDLLIATAPGMGTTIGLSVPVAD